MKLQHSGMLSPDRPQNQISKISRKSPILTFNEEQFLFENYRLQGDRKSYNKIINSHLKLVYRIASLFSTNKHDDEDLFSQGVTGLIKAVEKFDFRNKEKIRFCSYCYKWIKGEIHDYLLQFESQVPISKSSDERKLRHNLKRAMSKSTKDLTYDELKKIAGKLSVSFQIVERIYARLYRNDISRDYLDGESEEYNWVDNIHSHNPFDDVQKNDLKKYRMNIIFKAAKKLKKNERTLLAQRYFKGRKLKEVALKQGISIEGTRQMQERCIGKIKTELYVMQNV